MSLPRRIYLDHAATTPLRPEARQAMEPFLCDAFGNASSLHAEGQRARRALDTAREIVSGALGARFGEVVFTSGGTEADNMALVGVLLAAAPGAHLVVTSIEHEAILNTARFLEKQGVAVTFLCPDRCGRIAPEQVRDALTPRTVLVSVMHGNNEVGALQPVREIAEAARAGGALFHTDAVQTFGQLPVRVNELGADLLTVSAHKIGGPKGAGALYVRDGVALEPFLHGGAQERQKRAGTENVAAIAGFGEAVRCLLPERDAQASRLCALRGGFISQLRARIPAIVLNGHPTLRLPNNVNVSLPGRDAETLLLQLDRAGIAASSGSACTSGSIEPSHVLTAMGLPDALVRSALRFTLGRETTASDLARTVETLAALATGRGPNSTA